MPFGIANSSKPATTAKCHLSVMSSSGQTSITSETFSTWPQGCRRQAFD